MTTTINQSKIVMFALVGVGAMIGYTAAVITTPTDLNKDNYIADLEFKITQIEQSLETELTSTTKPLNIATTKAQDIKLSPKDIAAAESAGVEPDVDMGAFNQQHKDLITRFIGDPRNFVEKSADLIADKSNTHAIAIIAKGVHDLADVKEIVSDYDLETLYNTQKNPDLQRVAAQVMSSRGDNRLIENHAASLGERLNNASVEEKRRTLNELGRLRHVAAANVIAPLLSDPSDEVKLDALLALKLTGNQSHLDLVRTLTSHPNESVSWLANDVVNNLQIYSDVARTRVSQIDVAAELPIN